MLSITNNVNQNTNFTGNYSGRLDILSNEARTLAKSGVQAMKDAGEYLSQLQSINKGKYVLSNMAKPSKIVPRLSAKVDDKTVTMMSYSDGFNLQVKNDDHVDLLTVWGGDFIEFESTAFPLKANEFRVLESPLLERVECILKKYMPIFVQ